MIATLKLWVFVALIIWLVLLWKWNWSRTLLGVRRVQVEDDSRKWYEMPKEEWVEREPTYLDALYFSLAWPLLITAFVGALLTYLIMGIVGKS